MNKNRKFSNYELPFTNYHLPEAGFTLMELMVVIAIIVLLAGIMTPNVARRLERAKMTRAESDIAGIENAIAMYENDIGRYPESYNRDPDGDNTNEDPTDIQLLEWRLTGRVTFGSYYTTSLGDTDPRITNDSKWHGPYIKGIEQDSWKQDYVYLKNDDPRDPPLYANQTVGVEYPNNGAGGCVIPPHNLSYYIYSLGKNKGTGTAVTDWDGVVDGDSDNEDDINNWDVQKNWREKY